MGGICRLYSRTSPQEVFLPGKVVFVPWCQFEEFVNLVFSGKEQLNAWKWNWFEVALAFHADMSYYLLNDELFLIYGMTSSRFCFCLLRYKDFGVIQEQLICLSNRKWSKLPMVIFLSVQYLFIVDACFYFSFFFSGNFSFISHFHFAIVFGAGKGYLN